MSSIKDIKDELVQVLHDALGGDNIGDEAASKLLAVIEKLDPHIAKETPRKDMDAVNAAFANTNLQNIPMTEELLSDTISNQATASPPAPSLQQQPVNMRGSVVFLENVEDQPNKWLAKTYSGYGSFRRQTVFSSSPTGAIVPQSLSFRGAGMPTLDLNAAPDPRSQFSRRTARHTDVFHDGDHIFDEANGYGYEVYPLDNIDSADFDSLMLEGDDRNKFLLTATNVLFRYSLIATYSVDIKVLLEFLDNVFVGSAGGHFHGPLHAANVMQATHQYFLQPNVKENFTDVEILSTLMSALICCLGRKGVTNEFLAQISHPMVKIFGDIAPQEMLSVAIGMDLFERFNFMRNSVVWNDDALNMLVLREMVNEIVVRSAPRFHEGLLGECQEMIREGVIHERNIPRLATAVVHAADMTHATKGSAQYLRWMSRTLQQSFAQGDSEGQYGLEVSAMFDRSLDVGTVINAQSMWLRLIVRPFLTALQDILPPYWATRMEENIQFISTLTELPREESVAATFQEVNGTVCSDMMSLFERALAQQPQKNTAVVSAHHQAMLRVYLLHVEQQSTAAKFTEELYEMAAKLDPAYVKGIPAENVVTTINNLPKVDMIASHQLECDSFFLFLVRSYPERPVDAPRSRYHVENLVYSPKRKV